MARHKDNGVELVSGLSWQAGIVLGIVGYTGVRYVLAWFVSILGGPFAQSMGKQLSQGPSIAVAWLLLSACWIAALVSYIDSRRRKRLLETQSRLNSLRTLDWREFESMVDSAFRREGYTVEQPTHDGSDEGIDLILRKNGTVTLVHCRQWWAKLVDVRLVREMAELKNHHYADAVKIIAIGHYTDDARQFAQNKPIELIRGDALLDMLRRSISSGTQTFRPLADQRVEPLCPVCGHAMLHRVNRKSGRSFWDCSDHPHCQGTRVA